MEKCAVRELFFAARRNMVSDGEGKAQGKVRYASEKFGPATMRYAREEHCETLMRDIAKLLPVGHRTIEWVDSAHTERGEDSLISDLGVCAFGLPTSLFALNIESEIP